MIVIVKETRLIPCPKKVSVMTTVRKFISATTRPRANVGRSLPLPPRGLPTWKFPNIKKTITDSMTAATAVQTRARARHLATFRLSVRPQTRMSLGATGENWFVTELTRLTVVSTMEPQLASPFSGRSSVVVTFSVGI